MVASKKRSIILSILLFLLVGLFFLSLCIGNYKITLDALFTYFQQKLHGATYDQGLEAVLVNIRLARIVAAICVGAALSVSGLVYQTVFFNNMVSPDLLGVSSAAACGAAVAIVCGLPANASFLVSFVFSVLAVALSGGISKFLKRKDSLLLSGIIVAGFAKSALGLIKYLADSENGELESIVYWELGSLAKVSWEQLAIVFPAIVLILSVLFLLKRRISCLVFGQGAQLLGIHFHLERVLVIALASFLVSLSTAMCGVISWVSLIIPLAAAELTGSGSIHDNMVITGLLGSVFLLMADNIARAATTSEIPISIMTGAAGLIVFCVAVFSRRKKHTL